MALIPPTTLSPSKMATYRQCPKRFQFSAIDRLVEPPTLAATKGTVVHAVLEHLAFSELCGEPVTLEGAVDHAMGELAASEVADVLGLDERALTKLRSEVGALSERGVDMARQRNRSVVGVELGLEATIEGARVRGIIDRLERDGSGDFVIVDYKTGRPPRAGYENVALSGLSTYATLLQATLGVVAVGIELWYLQDGTEIRATPTAQSVRGQRRTTAALWATITRACASEQFPAKTSALCRFCGFVQLCPTGLRAIGGNDGVSRGVGQG